MHSQSIRWQDFGLLTPELRAELTLSQRSPARSLRAAGYKQYRRGIYYVPAESEDWTQRLALLLCAAGPNALAERQSAAVLWGLDGFEPPRTPIQVQVPRTERPRLSGVRRVDRLLPPGLPGGLAATSLDETLLCLGHELASCAATTRRVQFLRPDERIELAVESGLRAGLTTFERLSALAEGAGRRRPGAEVLRMVLARRGPSAPPTESYLETRGAQVLRNGGLPDFDRQVELVLAGRKVRLDLALGRAVVEFDGRAPHEHRFDDDRRRWNLLADAGYDLRVFTWDDVEHEPTRTVDTVRRLLGST